MDKAKRGKRIMQKVRNLSKWMKRERVKVKVSGERFTIQNEKNAHIEANHGKRCSCDMCCNPRHSGFYKGTGRLTIQERKANEKANERFDDTD